MSVIGVFSIVIKNKFNFQWLKIKAVKYTPRRKLTETLKVFSFRERGKWRKPSVR